ncbi:GEVED domain-containing protein [Flavobacterium sp. W20_MBD1_R3]|uniref:Ig-like domain-containing protein n=1 Tax=Flavobacterium sp. W20_MBD1_R3 TaxID=3240278 RepID=UPI003F93B07A
MNKNYSTLKKLVPLFFLLFSFAAFSQTIIRSQSFDSGASGYSDDLGYTVSSSTSVTVTSSTFESSPNSLRFSNNRNSNVVFDNVDISAFSNVSVTVSFKAVAIDRDEDLYLDISYDGGANYSAIRLVDGDNNNPGIDWRSTDGDNESVSSNPYTFFVPAGNSQIKIRIRATDLDNNEFFYVDNIIIKSDKYCRSSGNKTDGYVTGIRLVKFNTIDKSTPSEDNDYSDFTGISTSVTQGTSYDLTVNLNTSGNYRIFAMAWIDWNQDGDFLDLGEAFILGNTNDNPNGRTSESPLNILIPTTALPGNTRMRISAKWNVNPTSCETGFDGEVEDYTINILERKTITTGAISPTSYCAGAAVSIPYTTTGIFNAGNIFTAQLSDATGNFGSPVTIGALSSIAAGSILGTMPAGTVSGTGYRIRVVSSNPAVTGSTNVVGLTVNTISTAPTSIIGTTTICSGSTTTLTASGGILGTGGTYEWGIGSTVGSNIISGATSVSYTTLGLTSNTTYWVRRKDPAPCNTVTSGITQVVTVNTISTAPTSITGTTTICSGSTATLTASGGTLGTGGTYEWGTGSTVGSNVISGATSVSYTTLGLTSNTTYWVRRKDPAPCNTVTGGITQLVIVNTISTAPTSITGTTTICSGGTTTLTASGGILGTGGSFEWGTGSTVGSNIISGATSVSYTTLGLTSNTTYWVRRKDSAPCNTVTSGITQLVTVNTISTAPTSITGTTTICIGGTTTLTASGGILGTGGSFEWGTGSTVGSNIISGATSVSYTTLGLTSNTTYWVRRKDSAPCNTVTSGITQLVTVNTISTAPTSITGTTTICSGSTTTLTASGGILGTGGSFEWGTGSTVGSNIISGATSVSYTALGLTSNTTYWVRRKDPAPCNTVTGGTTQLVTVSTTAPPALGAITQPTCIVSTGSVVLSGLPATDTWTLYQNGTPIGTGTGDTKTVENLAPGNYTFTMDVASCLSVGSDLVVIKPVPLIATYNGGWTTGPPTIEQSIVFETNYTSLGNLEGCDCTVNAGVQVNVLSGHTLKITNAVKVNTAVGTSLTFENNSSLVQVNDDAINEGKIIYKRLNNTYRETDYTYWSSPVAGQILSAVSPKTPSGFFYSFNAAEDNWNYAPPSTIMGKGIGYIIRGPKIVGTPPLKFHEASFEGTPNNGDYEVDILVSALGKSNNLIGNPYPSALDAESFLIANREVLQGTLYFWTHNTPIRTATGATNEGSGDLVYISDDYASYNLTGGVGTEIKKIITTGNMESNVEKRSNKPSGMIASGQGFFATGKAAGKARFKNSMRVGVNDITLDNGQFFKTTQSSKNTNAIEKNRVWLNLTNDKGAFKQVLIGYITDATNGYDNVFDGANNNGNQFVNFYSINADKNLTIQARALPFDENDAVPLGYSSVIQGSFSISIDEVDGFLSSQNIYLEDKSNNSIYDLKKAVYTFSTEKGTFNDRFVLRYTNRTLGLGDFDTAAMQVLVSVKNKQIKINSSVETIDKVFIYDVLGKQIFEKTNVDNLELVIPNLGSSDQALIVKTVLQSGQIVTTKTVY